MAGPATEKVRLYQKGTGAPKYFTADEAHAALLTGQWRPRNDQILHVQRPDGAIGDVPAAGVGDELRAGARIVTEQDVHRAELHEKFGGVKGAVIAGVGGALGSATLGLTDAAASALGGDEAREALASSYEEHPYVHAAAGVLGAIAPTILSGGAAGAAEGANLARGAVGAVREGAAIAKGANAVAHGAELGAEAAKVGGIGTDLAAGARTAAQTIGAPARAVAAGGDLVEHAIVQGLGQGGHLATRAFKSAIAMGARGAVEGAAYGAGGAISENALSDDPDLTAEKLLAGIGHGALYGAIGGAGVGAASKLGGAALGRLGKGLVGVAEENAWRVTDGRKAFTTAANKIPGGTRGIGRMLLDEGVIAAGDNVASAAPKIAQFADQTADKLNATFSRVGSDGIPVMSVLDKMERRAADFDRMLEHEAAANAVRSMRMKVGQMFGVLDATGAVIPGSEAATVPLKKLLDQRRIVERTINWQTETVLAQGRRAGSRTIEDAITEHGDTLAKAKGDPAWRKDYEADKLQMRRAIVADDAATDSVMRHEANRQVSPSDYLTGIGGAIAGTVMHGPMGALEGAALSYAHKLVRERGNSTAAVLLDKLANMGAMKRVMGEVDTKIDDGIAGFMSSTKPKRIRLHRVSSAGLRDEYEEKAASVKRAESDPQHAQDALVPVVTVAPKTGASLAQGVTRATAYLASKLPAGHDDAGALQPQFQESRVSDAEAAKFLRYWRGVHDPGAAIDRMKHGTLSFEEVDAIKTVYPKLYGEIREKAIGAVVDAKRQLSYQQKVQLGILLDFPADRTMTPEFMATIAKGYAMQPPAPSPTASSKPLPDIASSYATATQRSLELNKV